MARLFPENATKVIGALDEFGFASLGLTVDDLVQPDTVIQLGYEPNRVDLLTGLSGVQFEDVYSKRVYTTIDGRCGGTRPMTVKREIASVVRKSRLGEIDEQSERRAYWAAQPMEARIAEVEVLRRLWIELTGDPDQPMHLVVHKRRLGDSAPVPPPGDSANAPRRLRRA